MSVLFFLLNRKSVPFNIHEKEQQINSALYSSVFVSKQFHLHSIFSQGKAFKRHLDSPKRAENDIQPLLIANLNFEV